MCNVENLTLIFELLSTLDWRLKTLKKRRENVHPAWKCWVSSISRDVKQLSFFKKFNFNVSVDWPVHLIICIIYFPQCRFRLPHISSCYAECYFYNEATLLICLICLVGSFFLNHCSEYLLYLEYCLHSFITHKCGHTTSNRLIIKSASSHSHSTLLN